MNDAERLGRIKERAARASEGPWRLGHYRGFGEEHDVDGPDGRALSGERGMFYRKADAEFVAHAREDVPWLVEALEGTLAELDGLRQGRRDRSSRPLSEEEAMRLANEELHAWRRERRETRERSAGPREGESQGERTKQVPGAGEAH